jgi:hypothetical protein
VHTLIYEAGRISFLTGEIHTHPSENSNWRKHKNACPFYRERWFPYSDVAKGEPMYQVFCLQETPPVTSEEQEKCFRSRTCCWRLVEKKQQTNTTASASSTADVPLTPHANKKR